MFVLFFGRLFTMRAWICEQVALFWTLQIPIFFGCCSAATLLRIGAWICENVALFWTSQIPLCLCCFSAAFSQWGPGFVIRSPCFEGSKFQSFLVVVRPPSLLRIGAWICDNTALFWRPPIPLLFLFGRPPMLRIGAWICDNVALFGISQISMCLCCFSAAPLC